MIPLWRDVTTAGGGPGLPRVVQLARTEVWRGYHREARRLDPGRVAVQVTLAGHGLLWAAPGRPPLPVPRGRALLFRTGVDRLAYGLPPEGGRWDFVYANLEGAAAHAMAADLVAAHGHLLAIEPRHPAVATLVALDRERADDLPLPAAQSARLALDLLLALLEAAPGPDGADGALTARAMAELQALAAEPGAVAAAARRLGVSREHLARAFRRAAGTSPSAWLRDRRLARAAALLADPGLPVAEVARRCGFATASHFVQAFRRARGHTPGAFRRGDGPARRPASG